jgi:hypothetical protein
MYRSYPDPWALAQKPGIGAPRVLARKEERFTVDEVLELLRKGKEYNDKPLLDKLKGSLFGG